MRDRKLFRRAMSIATSWVSSNIDKIELVMTVLKIITTKSPSEVRQFQITMDYTTEEGKTYKLKLPMTKEGDSSEIQNVIASIVVASADDINAVIEEKKRKVVTEETPFEDSSN